MKKPTTSTSESVSEYRGFVQLRLRKQVLEAIEIVLDEELGQALGCGAYERSEERRGYRRRIDPSGDNGDGHAWDTCVGSSAAR